MEKINPADLVEKFLDNSQAELTLLVKLNGSQLIEKLDIFEQFIYKALSWNIKTEIVFDLLKNVLRIIETKGLLPKFKKTIVIAIQHKYAPLETSLHFQNRLGQIFKIQHSLDKAIDIHKKSLKVAQENQLPNAKGESLYHLASNAFKQHNLSQALAFAEESELILKDSQNLPLYLTVANLIGLIKTEQGEFKQSVPYFTLTNCAWEKLNQPIHQARCLYNLGRSFHLAGDTEKAKQYFEIALGLTGNNNSEVSRILNGLGNVLLDESEFDSASTAYKSAQKNLEFSQDFKELQAYLYHNLSYLNVCQEKYLDSIHGFEKAILIWHETNNNLEKARSYGVLAEVYLKTYQFQRALPIYDLAIEIVKEYPHKKVFLDELISERLEAFTKSTVGVKPPTVEMVL